MTKHIPLNVLELVGISENQTVREAIEASLDNAELIDKLGFKRLWFAEHHNKKSCISCDISADCDGRSADKKYPHRLRRYHAAEPFTAAGR